MTFSSDHEKTFLSFRSASDVAIATKQLRTVLEKGKTSLAEVDLKVLPTKQSSFKEHFGKLGCISIPCDRWSVRIERV